MRVGANITALRTINNMSRASRNIGTSSSRLSSGHRINVAADDAAGFAIVTKIRRQLGGVQQASVNSSNGMSMLQTAEGALMAVSDMLQRIRELSVYAANDTQGTDDRQIIQNEIEQLLAEIDSVAFKTEYNKIKLLAGDAGRLIRTHRRPNDRNAAAGDLNLHGLQLLRTSSSVPYGRFDFRVMAIATKAEIEIPVGNGIDWTTDIDVPGPPARVMSPFEYFAGRTITINGYTIGVAPDDTASSLFERIRTIAEIDGVLVERPPIASQSNQIIGRIVASDYGSRSPLEISGNLELLHALGLLDVGLNLIPETLPGFPDGLAPPTDLFAAWDALLGDLAGYQTVLAGLPEGDPGIPDAMADIARVRGELQELQTMLLSEWPMLENLTGEITHNFQMSVRESLQRDFGDYLSPNEIAWATHGLMRDMEYQINDALNQAVRAGAEWLLDWLEDPNRPVPANIDLAPGFLEFLEDDMEDALNTVLHDFRYRRLPPRELDDPLIGMPFSEAEIDAAQPTFLNPADAGPPVVPAEIISIRTSAEQALVTQINMAFSRMVGNFDALEGADAEIEMFRDAQSQFTINSTYRAIGNRVTFRDIEGREIVVQLGSLPEGFDPNDVPLYYSLNTERGAIAFQIGANKDINMPVTIPRVTIDTLEIDRLNVLTVPRATNAIEQADRALSIVSNIRAELGALQNRLEFTVRSLDQNSLDLATAASRVADTNMASEMTEFSKNNVILQAGISILAQANMRPQSVLQLLNR